MSRAALHVRDRRRRSAGRGGARRRRGAEARASAGRGAPQADRDPLRRRHGFAPPLDRVAARGVPWRRRGPGGPSAELVRAVRALRAIGAGGTNARRRPDGAVRSVRDTREGGAGEGARRRAAGRARRQGEGSKGVIFIPHCGKPLCAYPQGGMAATLFSTGGNRRNRCATFPDYVREGPGGQRGSGRYMAKRASVATGERSAEYLRGYHDAWRAALHWGVVEIAPPAEAPRPARAPGEKAGETGRMRNRTLSG